MSLGFQPDVAGNLTASPICVSCDCVEGEGSTGISSPYDGSAYQPQGAPILMCCSLNLGYNPNCGTLQVCPLSPGN